MRLIRIIPFLLLSLTALGQSSITVVTNVANLLALTPVTTRPVVQVLGQVTANDGLGRDVIWSAASSDATNTWAAGGPIARPYNSATGRWFTLTNSTFPAYLPLTGGTMSGATVYNPGVITASQPDTIRQTWSNGAVAFNGLLIDITSTANLSSTFLDCYDDTNRRFWVTSGGSVNASQIILGTDAVLSREGSNAFRQSNGANAQTYNLYGTTDAGFLNYRRLRTTMTTGGAVTVAAEGLGSGVSGNTYAVAVDGTTRLSIASTGVPTFTTDQLRLSTFKTPSSASDTGTAGTICYDANYIYICTAANTWKRVAIATW